MAIRKALPRTRKPPTDGQTENGLCRISKAAEFLAVSERMVERLISMGKLDSVKIGRARRIKWPSLRAYAGYCD